jgi:hypothetical protein
MPYGITWLLMPPWLVRPRHAYSLPRGNLIRHAALMANLPRFARLYSFITRFLGQILKAFWCSKWVIWDIVGKLEKSTFQRYKFCMNRSSNGKVMAPGSRGVRAIFFAFFRRRFRPNGGKLPANRELRLVSGVPVFLMHPSLRIKSQRAGRNLRAKAVIREKKRVRFSTCFSYFRQFLRAW